MLRPIRALATVVLVCLATPAFADLGKSASPPSTPPTEAAAAAGNDLPFYVSAKFKKVAKRAFRQFAVGALKDACKGAHPLCEPLVDAVARAFGAALEGNLEEVKKVLS